jgi:hypothetical protein
MWDTRAARWEAHYSALVGYAATHGHARVPTSCETGGLRLGSWVIAQRAKRKRGELEAEREHRLAAVTGWTWEGRLAASLPPGAQR